jgi:hypothetical protein
MARQINRPSTFFPGFQNGAATVSALRFAQDWTHRTIDTVFALSSRFSVGLNVLGATINAIPIHPTANSFLVRTGSGNQTVRRKLLGMQLLSRMGLQFTNSPLFPLEQVAVGGRYTVRGYREVTLLRDNVFLFSVESRFPLWRWAERRAFGAIAVWMSGTAGTSARTGPRQLRQTLISPTPSPVSVPGFVGISCPRIERSLRCIGDTK